MNIAYYQNMLIKELISVINSSSDIEINISSDTIETKKITKVKAIEELFEIGLDINLSINNEYYGKEKVTPIIEYISSNADDFDILKLVFKHLDNKKFSNLSYEKQCIIFGDIVSKTMSIENRNTLLDNLFQKGFQFKQTDITSTELDWIDYGYTEFVDSTLKNQPSFNWNHVYSSHYQGESVTILEKIIMAIESTNSSTSSNHKKNKLEKLEHMLEQVGKICVFQSLQEDLKDKGNNLTKIKI